VNFIVVEGVLITEDEISGGQYIRDLEVSISRQNSLLSEVQKKMVEQAIHYSGNVIGNFSYSQKSHSRLQLALPKWDSESLVATGKLYLFDHDPRD
jgi:hypothetical protein